MIVYKILFSSLYKYFNKCYILIFLFRYKLFICNLQWILYTQDISLIIFLLHTKIFIKIISKNAITIINKLWNFKN